MIRIIITSDSHGSAGKLFTIVEKQIKSANYFVNLGDCRNGDDLESTESLLKMKFIRIAGNCDTFYNAPDFDFLEIAGKRILICHGHTFSVKSGYGRLMDFAERAKCDAALFGHTHTPHHEYTNSIHYFCPGAVMKGEYGILDIADGKIICINAAL